MIALVAGGAVALLAVNQFVLSPLFARGARVDKDLQQATLALDQANGLFANDPRMKARWQEMVAAGLTSDASEAESRALQSLSGWAKDVGLGPPSSLKPERREDGKPFQRVTLRASGTGSMETVGEFLWRIQTADIPIRVTDLALTTNTEGTDELTMEVGVSTICLAPEPPKKGAGGAPAAPPRPTPTPAGRGGVR